MAWGAVGLDCMIDILNEKPYFALLAAALALSIRAGHAWHAERLAASNQDLAERIQASHQRLAERLTNHVLSIKEFFGIGVRARTVAMIQAADERAPSDTGPYPVYTSKAT